MAAQRQQQDDMYSVWLPPATPRASALWMPPSQAPTDALAHLPPSAITLLDTLLNSLPQLQESRQDTLALGQQHRRHFILQYSVTGRWRDMWVASEVLAWILLLQRNTYKYNRDMGMLWGHFLQFLETNQDITDIEGVLIALQLHVDHFSRSVAKAKRFFQFTVHEQVM